MFVASLTGPAPSAKIALISLVYWAVIASFAAVCMDAQEYPPIEIAIGEATIFITLASYIAYVALSRVIARKKTRNKKLP